MMMIYHSKKSKDMSTTHQRESLKQYMQTGKGQTQEQAIEAYIARCQMATTKMIADNRQVPLSTATARLDSLASRGIIEKAETPAGKTAWQYVTDPARRKALARRYDLEKVRRNIDRLIRADEKTRILPSNLVNRLKLAGSEVEWAMAESL